MKNEEQNLIEAPTGNSIKADVTSSRDFHHLTCYEARKKKFKKNEAWENN